MDFEEHKAEALEDIRTVDELVRDALSDDEEISSRAVVVLHYKGSRDVLDASARLSVSSSAAERSIAAVIVAQLGVPERTFPNESFDILSAMLHVESDDDVLSTVAAMFNFLENPKKVDLLIPLKAHENPDVRYGVVKGLLTCDDVRAIEALIQLSRDVDSDVRDWATFGIGSQIRTDTSEIRAALFERVNDEDDDTRGEALVGLAIRKDTRLIEPLIEELNREDVGMLALEAAEEIGDPRLMPILTELQQSWSEDDDRHVRALNRALLACMPEHAPIQ